MQRARPICWPAVLSITALTLMLPPAIADAQSDGEREGVREAGDDARFRVIERFPERQQNRDAPESEDLELAISEQLAEAMEQNDWARAARLFDRRLGKEEPSHAFLRGYIEWKRGRWNAARKQFDAAAQSWSMLDDYAAYFAADAAFKAGDYHVAVVRGARVPTSSRLFGDALAVMARGLVKKGTGVDRRRAVRVATRYLDHFPTGEHAAKMRLTLGRLHLDAGEYAKAADRLFALIEEHPLSEEAEEAERLLEKHRKSFSESVREKIDQRPKELQLAHLGALYESHASEEVIKKGSGWVEGWTPGGRTRCQGLYWIARSHTKLRQHEKALDWYDRVLDECEGVPPYERNALYVGGKSYWNAGKKEQALEWFERLWTRYDHHSFADDGMYFAARIHRELDQTEQASELLADQVDRYPDGDMAADAHWLRVREMYAEEDYEGVVEYVDGLEQTGEHELYTRGRLHYFRARALQLQGEGEKALDAYVDVARSHPLTLYALYALNRVARMKGIGSGEKLCEAVPAICDELTAETDDESSTAEGGVGRLPKRVRNDAAYRRGAALLRIGIREWARREFDLLFAHYAANKDALLALADLLDRAGAHAIAYGLPGRMEGWRDRYPDAGSRRAWTIAYPKAYEATVEKWAGKRDVPASLVWAIIRKESGYNPSIESWANARGLMQLMEGTAKNVAKEIGFGTVEATDLLAVESNIELGTAYLAKLGEQLDGQLALMAAGYNGGYGNISDWLEARGELPLDLWIEAIPYGQTRRYAKVVLANDWTYRWLHEGKTVPRLTFDLGGIVD